MVEIEKLNELKMDLMNKYIKLHKKYQDECKVYKSCTAHWDNDIIKRLNREIPIMREDLEILAGKVKAINRRIAILEKKDDESNDS